VFTDRAGLKKAHITSSAPVPCLLGAKFDLKKNGGCNELSFTIDRTKLQGNINLGYLVTVSVALPTQSLTPYWKGSITKVPVVGSTARAWEYEARGLVHELAQQRIVKYYAGKYVNDLVADILADVDSPVTAISASTSEFSVASPYVVGDYEVEFEDAEEIIKQLSILQGNVQYGVDQNGKLYFRDLITTVQSTHIIGKHLTELRIDSTLDEVVNDVYLQSKIVVGGGQLTIYREDPASKISYGMRTQVSQMRNSKKVSDFQRYADAIIERQKDAKQIVEAAFPAFTGFQFPRGNVRMLDTDGTAYTFPIERVTYELNPTAGLIGSMEVGDRLVGTVEERFKDVLRRVERTGSNAISLTKIEHTKGEEFAQAAIVDARKNGKYNIFTDTLSDLKALDPARSSHMEFRDNYISAPLDFAFGLYESNAIPTGDIINSGRLHLNLDAYGRINFYKDSDLAYFFSGTDIAMYRVVEGGLGLEGFQASGNILFYKDLSASVPAGQTGFSLPDKYRMRFRFDYVKTSAAGAFTIYFAWTSATDECRVDIKNGASNMTFVLIKRVAGAPTTLETATLTKDANYIVELFSDSVNNTVQMVIYDEAGSIVFTGASYAFTHATGTHIGFYGLYDVTDLSKARIRWLEIDTVVAGSLPKDIDFFVSRDNGVTWTGDYVTFGDNGLVNKAFDVSAQPLGTSLRARMIVQHPARVYGWGISW